MGGESPSGSVSHKFDHQIYVTPYPTTYYCTVLKRCCRITVSWQSIKEQMNLISKPCFARRRSGMGIPRRGMDYRARYIHNIREVQVTVLQYCAIHERTKKIWGPTVGTAESDVWEIKRRRKAPKSFIHIITLRAKALRCNKNTDNSKHVMRRKGGGRDRQAMRSITEQCLKINLHRFPATHSRHHHRPHPRACPFPIRLFCLFPRCRHLHWRLSHRPAGHTMARNVALERLCNGHTS